MGQALRRAFLCGVDRYSGQNYEHLRQWVLDRIRLLSSLFAIDVCAYAVMKSNHYHLALKLCPGQIEELDDDEVMDRWCALFKGPLLIQRYRDGEDLESFERTTVSGIVNVWRSKLSSLSWFMRCLNQPIAPSGQSRRQLYREILGIPVPFKSTQVRRSPVLLHGLCGPQPGTGRDCRPTRDL